MGSSEQPTHKPQDKTAHLVVTLKAKSAKGIFLLRG